MRNLFGVTQSLIPDPCTFSNPGSDIYHIMQLSTDDDTGLDYLEEVGQMSISTQINSFRDLTDMSYILARLNAGDSSVLNARSSFYGDVSDLPHDHRAALDIINNARMYFDHLSDDIKVKFDNDFAKWFSSAGSADWSAKMTVNPDPAPVPAAESDGNV